MSRRPSLLTRRFRPRLDWLEAREVPAVFTVTSATDDPLDANTLRAAIGQANRNPGADEIRFDLPAGSTITVNPNAFGATGSLQGPLPTIFGELTVTGPGLDSLTVSGGKQTRVFAVSSSAVAASFSGLTVADGLLVAISGEPNPFFSSGAGIFNEGATLNLSEVRLRNNSTAGVVGPQPGAIVSANGSAVYTAGPTTVVSSLFEGNTGSLADGGAIFAIGPAAGTRVADSTFTGNTVSQGSGGAIFAENAPLTVTGSTFSKNSAGFDGGAVSSGLLTAPRAFSFDQLTFSENTATERGGAVDLAAQVNLTATRLTFTGNTAQQSGGGLYQERGSTAALTDAVFVGNTSATASGGGVHAQGELTVSRGLFQGNKAGTAGGGVFFEDAVAGQGLTNVTLTGNSAAGQGGGVYADDGTGLARLVQLTVTGNTAGTGGGLSSEEGDLALFNSVVVGNSASSGPADLDKVASVGGNVIGAADAESAKLFQASDVSGVTDAGLTAVGSYGGFSQSIAPRAASPAAGRGLASGNLVVNGSVLLSLNAPTTDQRGLVRPSDGFIDSGAVQPQRPTVLADTATAAPAGSTTIPASALLGNDAVADTGLGGKLVIAQVSGPVPGTGTLVLNSDGSLTYTAEAGFVGSDTTFTYRVSDGFSTSRAVTSTLRVVDTKVLTATPRPDYKLNLQETDTLEVDGEAADRLLAGITSPNGGTVRVASVTPGLGLPQVVFAPDTGDFVVDRDTGAFTLTLPETTLNGTYTFTYTVTDGLSTSAPATATITVTGGLTGDAQRFTAYSSGAGVPGVVRVIRPLRTDLVLRPFEASFLGGVRVAVADLTGDGVDDVVVGAGPSGAPRVVVYDGALSTTAAPVVLRDFYAFNADFRGGVHVAAADTADANGVKQSLLVCGAGSFVDQAADPHVIAFRGLTNVPRDGSVATSPAFSFYAYDKGFRGGVRVAAGDLNGTGTLQFATVPGPSGGPHVKVWDTAGSGGGTPAQRGDFFGLPDQGFRGGAFIAVGGGTLVVTPDSVPVFDKTAIQVNSSVLPDQNGTVPGTSTATNTVASPLAQVFVTPLLVGRPGTGLSPFVFQEQTAAVGLGDTGFLGGVRVAVGRPGGAGESVVLLGYGPGREGQTRTIRLTPDEIVGATAGRFDLSKLLQPANEIGSDYPLAGLTSGTADSVYVALAALPYVSPSK